MATFCFGLNSKDRRASFLKVPQLTFSLIIFVVKDLEYQTKAGERIKYSGEVDQDGKTCGLGVATPIPRRKSRQPT